MVGWASIPMLSPLELVISTEGKTDCEEWKTDGWGGYERVLPPEVEHQVGKSGTQRLERTNGILRQQTGRWHRHQNKFAKAWEQTQVTARLLLSYFNWIWEHSRLGTTAALACRFDFKILELEQLCNLSHTYLTHNRLHHPSHIGFILN